MVALCFVCLVMTYGLNNVLTGTQKVTETAQRTLQQAQDIANKPENKAPAGVVETGAQVGGHYPF